MINVNDSAGKKFKELAAKTDNPGNQMLRISLNGFG